MKKSLIKILLITKQASVVVCLDVIKFKTKINLKKLQSFCIYNVIPGISLTPLVHEHCLCFFKIGTLVTIVLSKRLCFVVCVLLNVYSPFV